MVPTNSKPRRVILGILGTILIGAVGSGLWDVVAKPGLGWTVSTILKLAGLFSNTVNDLPYSSAAMDASALPSLLLLQLASSSIPGIFFALATVPMLLRRYTPPVDKEQLFRRRRYLNIFNGGLALFLLMVGALTFTITNKAVAIRRTWEANFSILAPHVPSEVILQLHGQFAAITSKQEYKQFSFQSNQIAKENHVKLRPETDHF